MLYLKAGTEIKPLEEWKDEKGNFAKIFLINDQRNKNEWRATWESIKKNAQDFIGKPGIEYIKCVDGECDLDHTDAPTYAQNLKVQEPFRVSTIIDIILNENTHTAFAIHEIHDDMFAEKLQHKKVKYISPSIWPKDGQYEIIGKKANGELVIDVFSWYGLHSAFVNKPAFGDDAKVVAQCSDHKDVCMMRMLTAKELIADELDPLKEVPFMVKHKGYHTFVSVSECVRDIIQKKIDDGINITDQDLATAYSECGQTKKACNCQKAAIVSLKHRVGILDLKMRINNLSSKIKLVAGDEKNDKKGIWVTSNGQHIFIPDGKDKGDAVKEHFDSLKEKEKNKDNKEKEKNKDDKEKNSSNIYDKKSYNNSDKIKITVEKVLPDYEKHVSIAREVWNEMGSDAKYISEFRIGRPDTDSAAGTFNPKTKVLAIDPAVNATSSEDIKSKMRTIMIHEAAHAKYHGLAKDHPDKIKQWHDLALNTEPVTGYLGRYKTEMEESEQEYRPIKKSLENLYEREDNLTKKIADHNTGKTKLNLHQEIDVRTSLSGIRTRIDDVHKEYVKTKSRHDYAERAYANETHSEFMVMKKGAKSFYDENRESFVKLNKKYGDIFGDD